MNQENTNKWKTKELIKRIMTKPLYTPPAFISKKSKNQSY